MIETIAQYVLEKDWEAIFNMHSALQVCKSKNSTSIFFHHMDESGITPEEIDDIQGMAYFVEGEHGNFAVISFEICGVHITLAFN